MLKDGPRGHHARWAVAQIHFGKGFAIEFMHLKNIHRFVRIKDNVIVGIDSHVRTHLFLGVIIHLYLRIKAFTHRLDGTVALVWRHVNVGTIVLIRAVLPYQ